MSWSEWDDETRIYRSTDYVVVSAAVVSGSPETYIFPAELTATGVEITDWGELTGSYRGGLDQETALNAAGYTVVR